jgi:hypothetical protein
VSIRNWTKRKKNNYSQWYPSKYAVMLALVRAHHEAAEDSCLDSSYTLIRNHLLKTQDFAGNVYDQAMATSAVARIIKYEKLPKESLKVHIQKLHEMIKNKQYGKHPFFFYGAVGYTGSIPILKAILIEATSILLSSEGIRHQSKSKKKNF